METQLNDGMFSQYAIGHANQKRKIRPVFIFFIFFFWKLIQDCTLCHSSVLQIPLNTVRQFQQGKDWISDKHTHSLCFLQQTGHFHLFLVTEKSHLCEQLCSQMERGPGFQCQPYTNNSRQGLDTKVQNDKTLGMCQFTSLQYYNSQQRLPLQFMRKLKLIVLERH